MAESGFELSTPLLIQLVSGAVPFESGSENFWDPLEYMGWMIAIGSKVQGFVYRSKVMLPSFNVDWVSRKVLVNSEISTVNLIVG